MEERFKKPNDTSKQVEQAAEQLAEMLVALLDEQELDKTTPEVPGRPTLDKGG